MYTVYYNPANLAARSINTYVCMYVYVVAELLQDGCPFGCSTNSVKALKDDSVPDWDSMLPSCCRVRNTNGSGG